MIENYAADRQTLFITQKLYDIPFQLYDFLFKYELKPK